MFLSEQVLKLTEWFLSERSIYPWRENPTPYDVWISEVMLQQTQVGRVVTYFLRWMELLPTIHDVAMAEEDMLTKLWEGLGYYSRVRNIHKAAKLIDKKYQGVLPDTYEALKNIPGLGPYTISAILCFGYKKRAFPIDANIQRVLARFHAFTGRVDTTGGKQAIQALAMEWIPQENPHLVAEGIIEFGQKICGKKPHCTICPLRKWCLGKEQAEALPVKKKPKQRVFLTREVMVLLCGDKVWLYKESGPRIMQGLWQFPYDVPEELLRSKAALHFQGKMRTIRHGFTHHTVDLIPSLFFVDEPLKLPYGAWYGRSALHAYAFSSGHRTIARELYHALSCYGDALRILC